MMRFRPFSLEALSLWCEERRIYMYVKTLVYARMRQMVRQRPIFDLKKIEENDQEA
jgi:hypothetical protein